MGDQFGPGEAGEVFGFGSVPPRDARPSFDIGCLRPLSIPADDPFRSLPVA